MESVLFLTNLDDQTEILACTYIDDCHTKIGSTTFHIRQFAEIQENYGIATCHVNQSQRIWSIPIEIYRAVIGNAGGGVRSFEEAKKTLRAKKLQPCLRRQYAKKFAGTSCRKSIADMIRLPIWYALSVGECCGADTRWKETRTTQM